MKTHESHGATILDSDETEPCDVVSWIYSVTVMDLDRVSVHRAVMGPAFV